jgi:hypothetical protein
VLYPILFVVHLTTLSIAPTARHRMVTMVMNEFEKDEEGCGVLLRLRSNMTTLRQVSRSPGRDARRARPE